MNTFLLFLLLQIELHIGDILPELPWRDSLLKHLVNLSRRATSRLGDDKVSNGDDDGSDTAEEKTRFDTPSNTAFDEDWCNEGELASQRAKACRMVLNSP
jgi:hypothetical protein